MAACEEMAEMICDSSPLAVQAVIRLYRLTAAFPPSLVSYASHLDQEIAESEDGAEGPRGRCTDTGRLLPGDGPLQSLEGAVPAAC